MEESPPFQLVAGHVALDFVNTVDNRYREGRAVDLLPNYLEFLRFCRETGLITGAQSDLLGRLENGADAALRAASELREALERIFSSVIGRAEIPAADLEILNAALQHAMQHSVLELQNGHIIRAWKGLEENASGPLWLIADAAANLLVSEDLKLVRECGNSTCRWLFLDTSKNHSRRWCDMKLCGNRLKARNYYQRTRKGNGA